MSPTRCAVGLALMVLAAPIFARAEPVPANSAGLPRQAIVRLTSSAPVYRVWFIANGDRVLGLTAWGWVTWPTSGGPATALADSALLYAHDNTRRESWSDV